MTTLNLQRASKRQGNSGGKTPHLGISKGKKRWVQIDQCGKKVVFNGICISCLMSPKKQFIWWYFCRKHWQTQRMFFIWYAWICHIGPGFVGLVCWNPFGLRTCPEGHVEVAGGLCKGEGAGLVERNVSRKAITMDGYGMPYWWLTKILYVSKNVMHIFLILYQN